MASDRMTSIYLPTSTWCGLGEWGRWTVAEMIAKARERAEQQRLEAEAILNAPDEAFSVKTYVGLHRERSVEILQEGRTALRALGEG